MPKPKVLPVPVLAWPMMSWPGKPEGDGLLLDGERVDDALCGEGVDDVLVDAEFGEGRHDESLSGGEVTAGEVMDPRPSLIHRRGGPDPTPGTFQDTGRRDAAPRALSCAAARL